MKKKSASQSAFFELRLLVSVLLCFAAVTIVLLAQPQTPSRQSGPAAAGQPIVRAEYRGVLRVDRFDISQPMRDMIPLPAKECTLRENEEEGPIPLGPVGPVVPDKAVQRALGKIGIPSPIISFDGNSNLCGCYPPDPNGEVGPNHVVTMSNLHYQIFNKSGVSLFGPAANNTLWSNFGGHPCQTQNAGDPVVLYDQLADRWLLSQFTSAAVNNTYYECVALSQTSDPLGSYYRWAIATGVNNFPDYPKAGMWPDAYYFSTREFAGGATFVGVGAYALDRAQALVGNPNPTIVSFLAPPAPPYVVGDGLLPSDLDGMTPPPVGSPNYFVGSEDNNGPYGAPADALSLWKFHYDPMIPANSSFMLTNTLPTTPFNSILGLCGGTRNCIPQPGTAVRLDHQGYRQRPLFRLAYRNFGTHESLVTNQSVSAGIGPNGEVSGIRWWELRSPNSSPVIFQEGTYAPGLTDGVHRWFGSIAMNSLGDIALGFSASNNANPSLFPSVYYTGRLASDPPGQMTLGEAAIVIGTGSQTGTANRWGDYTDMTVDPSNDQDFWYVNEYIPTTSVNGWRLRVGAFNLAGGTPSPTPTASPSATATSTPTPTPSASCPPLVFENFDGVTPPTLPPNWTATQGINGGGFPFWVTSNSGVPTPVADSPPNAAFTVDPNNLLDNRLNSLTINYGVGAVLTFRQNYDLEEQDATTAYDLGVLEISVDNGATYQDIVTAGGSFVTGGYNHTAISTGFMNPCLPSRPSWSGFSNGGAGGFESVAVNLPPAGVGQQVKVRWRMCSDNSVSHAGWRVDTVAISGPCTSPTATPTATATATATASATATATATPAVTPTATATATATATSTATATVPPPRSTPTPRPRPTPWPRP